MESNPSLDDSRQIWSCVACRRRKVKCDRRAPGCEVCARMGLECHYPVTGRLPSRGRAPPQWSSSHQRQTDLLARLRRLEAVVTELSAQVDEVNEPLVQEEQTRLTPSETAASSTEIGEEPSEDFGTLVTGQDGRVRIARSFWSVFCDEVDHIFQSIQDASEVPEEGGPNPKSSLSTHMFGLGGDVVPVHHSDMDTSPTQLSFLLQSYKERVDPFIKVLATDTLKLLCDSWSTPSSELGLAQAALRSSALFGAVVGLAPAEVQAAFAQPKQRLLVEMRTTAELRLAQANYLSTSDLTVLQALVIYTSMLPYAGMQHVARPISASTVQIAMQNGLHAEAERHRCGDVDVRQILWLQVCFLSSRVQVADAAVSEFPPSAADTIACSERMYTDSHKQRFLLFIRHTIWNLSRQIRRLGRNPDPVAAESLTRAARSAVENQHQRQLHTKSAFVEFVHQMSVLFFSKIEHAFLAQRQPIEESERFAHSQALADAGITILEAIHSLGSRPEWSPWRWQLQGLFPWTAMKLVFARFAGAGWRWTPAEERAWVLAKAVAGAATEEVRRDSAWTALEKLMMAAEERRQRAMQRLMADAMAGGDYMRVIEAGQQVFYGEGSRESSEDGREPGGALNEDENAEKPGSGSFGSREISSLTTSWPDERSYFYDDLFY